MAKKVLLGGILGGIVLFFWGFVWHEVLPFGLIGIKDIPNENTMISAMKTNVPEAGMYMIPGLQIPANATSAQRKAAEEARQVAADAAELRAEIDEILAGLPNLPAGDVPDGPDETANRVLRYHGEPPHFNFAPLENAVDRLKKSASDYDRALAAKGAGLPEEATARLFDLAREAEGALAPEVGLPGRSWYKHLLYAPGRYTGYEPKTLPGVREAIEEERWEDADRYAGLTAAALNAYADKLDRGVQVMNAARPSASAN